MARWKRVEEKLINFSKDITFAEIVTLLEHYGYVLDNSGRTSGSRIRFVKDSRCDILLHKPYPQKYLKAYVVKHLHELIEQEGYWDE